MDVILSVRALEPKSTVYGAMLGKAPLSGRSPKRCARPNDVDGAHKVPWRAIGKSAAIEAQSKALRAAK